MSIYDNNGRFMQFGIVLCKNIEILLEILYYFMLDKDECPLFPK